MSSGENAEDESVHAMTARLPADLHEWLRREAFERRVSINSLLVEAAENLRRAAA
jgi:predicted HicB family RNase H-like nuclease